MKSEQLYRGYRLVPVSTSVVYIYLARALVTWALSLAQAKRLIDEMKGGTA